MSSDKKIKFLFPEMFVSLKSATQILWDTFRAIFVRVNTIKINGYDFTDAYKEHCRKYAACDHTYQALLNYYAIIGMRRKGIKIKNFYCWHEGQNLDKCIMLSLAKNYPSVHKISYQGFSETKYRLATYPTSYEKQSGVLPDVLAVCSDDLIPLSKRYLPDMNIISAPLFRRSDCTNMLKFDNLNNIVLFILSSESESINEYLSIFDKLIKSPDTVKSKFLIRKHPITHLPEKYNKFLSVNHTLSEDIARSNFIVTAPTSAGVEALISGKTTIVIKSRKFFTRDVIESISSLRGRYHSVYNEKDIIDIINTNRNASDEMAIDTFSSNIFPVANQKTMQNFLDEAVGGDV